MVFLTRSEPPRNVNRFYLVTVTPTLFGEWSVMREWGRLGSPGTLRLHTFDRQTEAHKSQRKSIERKLRRGYVNRNDQP
jgi:predicted DNA-binding WGR domain protein